MGAKKSLIWKGEDKESYYEGGDDGSLTFHAADGGHLRLDVDGVTLGEGAEERVLKARDFLERFDSHTHICGLPGEESSPPVVLLSDVIELLAALGVRVK